ncbi:MAG: hypothetical protein V4642_15500 [Bacteroidota bacterium]
MIDYNFWFWSRKLKGILQLLSALVSYDFWEDEYEAIKVELKGTDVLQNIWISYPLEGIETLKLQLASNEAGGSDIIYIKITAPKELIGKLEILNLFQTLVKDIEIER